MTYAQNDYTPLEKLVNQYQLDGTFSNKAWQADAKVSILITTYNQEEQLRKQLLALCQQSYDPNSIEVIIADDGSRRGSGSCMDIVAKANLPFDVKYVWQPDKGFRLAKARNEAIKRASHETIISLDADMIPAHDYVENVMKQHYAAKQYGTTIITTQDRGFVELNDNNNLDQLIRERKLHQVRTSPSRRFGGTNDWRHEKRYENTDRLKRIGDEIEDPYYFIGSTISGGNCSFHKADAFEAGLFDESFTQYGAEDTEFGVRLYEHFNRKLGKKLFFVPVDTIAYHLEHGGKPDSQKQQKAHQFFLERMDQARDREVNPLPEVSVYIPCYNQEQFIERALDSVVQQAFDLNIVEVVIGEDGSTDRSKEVIERIQQRYNHSLNIRVVDDGKNHGLAENTNRTIQACRGKYIVQLDPDDELLPEAINSLYTALERNKKTSLAFGDCMDVDDVTGQQKPHWSCPEFTPEWYKQHRAVSKKTLATILESGMRIHHPRMFRREAFFQTDGISPNLQSAVDYDLYSRLVEIGNPYHLKAILYDYHHNHGRNTSNEGKLQIANDRVVKRMIQARDGKKAKAVYIIDESESRPRSKCFDLNNPTTRSEVLYTTWKNDEHQEYGTKLYHAMINELESIVGFFRWVNPKVSRTELDLLLKLQPNSNVGNYYLATFLYSQGDKQKALQALRSIMQKGPSALALEQRIIEEIKQRAVA